MSGRFQKIVGPILAFAMAFVLIFSAARGVQAVHTYGLFELDRNAVSEIAAGDDWDVVVPVATTSNPNFITSAFATDANGDSSYWSGGGSKDIHDIPSWQVNGNSAPPKDEITNAYAAAYNNGGDLVIYVGMDRFAVNGNSNVGWWFLQDEVSLNPDGSFNGNHIVGDILLVCEFVNGGSVPACKVFEWVSSGGSNGSLDLLANGSVGTSADCLEQAGEPPIPGEPCATVNQLEVDSPWDYTPKSGTVDKFPPGAFIEGGINITDLLGQDVCFSTFLTETRSSQEATAVLKDLAGPVSFETCGSITINKVTVGGDDTFGYETTGGLDPANFNLSDGGSQVYSDLNPGNYSVSESALPEGWALTDIFCTASGIGTSVDIGSDSDFDEGDTQVNITLGLAGHVECTYTNTLTKLTVVKEILNTTPKDGSDDDRFNLLVDGVVEKANAGDGDSTGVLLVDAGTHTVSETAGSGGTDLSTYDVSIECVDTGTTDVVASNSGLTSLDVELEAGDDVTCTITNDHIPQLGRIAGVKFLDGGTAGVEDDSSHAADGSEPGLSGWEIRVYDSSCTTQVDANGDAAGLSVFTDSEGDYLTDQLLVGTYCVKEVLQDGWEQTYPDGNDDKTDVDNVDNYYLVVVHEDNATTGGINFGNRHLFRLIILTCDETNGLVVSQVDLDGEVKNTISQPPAGITAEELCALDGASYGNLSQGTYNPSVEIPAP